MNRSRFYNSPESRKIRSDRARKGAIATNLVKAEKRDLVEIVRDDLFEIVVRNKITGNEIIVEINKGTRSNNFEFIVDGEHWKTCGMARAEGLILASLAKAQKRR